MPVQNRSFGARGTAPIGPRYVGYLHAYYRHNRRPWERTTSSEHQRVGALCRHGAERHHVKTGWFGEANDLM
jgi:hypothetical protein